MILSLLLHKYLQVKLTYLVQTGRFPLLQHQDLKMRCGQQDRTVQTRVHSTSPTTHPQFHLILETEEQEEDILYLVVEQEEDIMHLVVVVVAMLIRSRLYETLFSPLLNALSYLVPARNCSRKQTLSLNVDKVHITYLGLFI